MARDTWDDGSAYDSYIGRWSRPVAREFVRRLELTPRSAWLDFGCGTGALTQAILAAATPRLVVGCDSSAGYVGFARQHIRDTRAEFVVTSLPDLPRVSGGFDAAVAGLVLNFLPAPADGLATLAGRVHRGGTVAAYVWDYAEGMELIRVFWDSVVELDPTARALDEAVRFPMCQPMALQKLFTSVGLEDVRVDAIEVPTLFRDFDDYWTPFLGGQGPGPSYALSLPPDARAHLRDAIRGQLPVARDGTIALKARAWAARGIAG